MMTPPLEEVLVRVSMICLEVWDVEVDVVSGTVDVRVVSVVSVSVRVRYGFMLRSSWYGDRNRKTKARK